MAHWTQVVFCPCLIAFEACRIYLGGCFGVYFRALAWLCGCGSKGPFRDSEFPPTAASVGAWQGKSVAEVEAEVEWRRVSDFCTGKQGTMLFQGPVEASDIFQGQVGDCWLLSSCACLAGSGPQLEDLFLTKKANEAGRYELRLYDRSKGRFVTVTVDDWVPCSKADGKTLFANPKGEAWVALLEKAMAKFLGSYADLNIGSILWGMQTLTGDYAYQFRLQNGDGKEWKRFEITDSVSSGNSISLKPTDQQLSSDDLFASVVTCLRDQSMVAAASGPGDGLTSVEGIVQGHAYSVVDAREVEGFKLLHIRNPWGTFEWTGDWSDASDMWKQHPKVAAVLHIQNKDDGFFWMEMRDFCRFYKVLNFCICKRDVQQELVLNIHEEMACCGPTWGCVSGCACFCCGCRGARAICCAPHTAVAVMPLTVPAAAETSKAATVV